MTWTDSDLQRFWAKVNKTDNCWLWTGGKGVYGVFWLNGKNVSAHKFSYQIHKGEIGDGLLVCHTCDTPLCVNPEHFFLGTVSDNAKDSVNKGRHRTNRQQGEKNHSSKLSNEQAKEIRRRYKGGEKGYKLAREYSVSPTTISDVVNGKIYEEG